MLGACSARLPPYGTADAPLLVHPVADDAFTMADGARLPVQVWLPPSGQPPRAVILALHGFNDSRDQWALPGPVFASAGIAVYAPDQRGFGDTAARQTWPGVKALVDDADTMARELHRRYPATPVYVMGESMGGAVALDLAARPNPPPIAGTIMLSPAVWGRSEQGFVLASALWAANGVAPGYRITAGDVPVRVHASDNRAALIALARDPLTIRSTQVSVLKGLVDLMDSAQAAAPRRARPYFHRLWRPRRLGARECDGGRLGAPPSGHAAGRVSERLPLADARLGPPGGDWRCDCLDQAPGCATPVGGRHRRGGLGEPLQS